MILLLLINVAWPYIIQNTLKLKLATIIIYNCVGFLKMIFNLWIFFVKHIFSLKKPRIL